MIGKIFLIHIFIDLKTLYFMKHDPEVKIFYSDKYHYFQDTSFGYQTLEVQYSKMLSGRINFNGVNQRIHPVLYPIRVSGRLNDTMVGVLQIFKS